MADYATDQAFDLFANIRKGLDDSPSHESTCSGLFSPTGSNENENENENELDHDADFYSSGDDTLFEPFPKPKLVYHKLRRRTSSNVFTFKTSPEIQRSNQDTFFELELDNENPKGTQIQTNSNFNSHNVLCKSQSFSSSADDENETSKSKLSCYRLEKMDSLSSTSAGEEIEQLNKRTKKANSVDRLLFEIYDRYHQNDVYNHVDSDITECSTTSATSIYVASSFENDDRPRLDKSYLQKKEIAELEKMIRDLKRGINMLSSKLVRLLKQRDRSAHKIQENFNVLTALLQAISQKRRVDTRIRFSFIPRPGKKGFRQWIDAMKAVARINHGIPTAWRKRTWLSLSEFFLKDADWYSIKKQCFNDRRNPDDDELDSQIVKDLHRTGCGWFFEHDTAEDRASLKRVLLAYARWNKSIGYCQGFNVIAALILQVMEGNEEHALKVMIFLVDYVLPRNYFANNLRALSVDMAVLRDLMLIKLPGLATHLQQLQKQAMDASVNTAASYEPPLINMFTMQWFLTLFATCLPRNTVLRIWDSALLEGSEVLLRVALAIWAKLGTYFDHVDTAADFYMKMGQLIQELIRDDFIDAQKLMATVYQMVPFPWSTLTELREKYTYDIHPFATFTSEKKAEKKLEITKAGFVSGPSESPSKVKHHAIDGKKRNNKSDITKATPGAYITDQETQNAYKRQIMEQEKLRESEKLDLGKLRNQYGRMRRLQQKAMLVFNNNDFKDDSVRLKNPPSAINHLFVDVSKVTSQRSRYRRPSNFPALKAPSKGTPSLKPVKESTAKVIHEDNRDKDAENNQSLVSNSSSNNLNNLRNKDKSVVKKDYSIISPYITHEVQATSDVIEETNGVTSSKNAYDHAIQNGSKKHNSLNNLSLHYTKDDVNKCESELKSTSLLYQIDKTALYPSNFKPFPQRVNSNRRKVQTGK